jgi:hypothetical protein
MVDGIERDDTIFLLFSNALEMKQAATSSHIRFFLVDFLTMQKCAQTFLQVCDARRGAKTPQCNEMNLCDLETFSLSFERRGANYSLSVINDVSIDNMYVVRTRCARDRVAWRHSVCSFRLLHVHRRTCARSCSNDCRCSDEFIAAFGGTRVDVGSSHSYQRLKLPFAFPLGTQSALRWLLVTGALVCRNLARR